MQLKQISKMHKDYNYTYGGIKATIYYVTCIKNINLENMSLGIIPYYYDEAKEHFLIKNRIREQVEYLNTTPVVVHVGDIPKPKKSKTKLIDISQIF